MGEAIGMDSVDWMDCAAHRDVCQKPFFALGSFR
jgi:hypothetical protein